jgi:hypothetical protein
LGPALNGTGTGADSVLFVFDGVNYEIELDGFHGSRRLLVLPQRCDLSVLDFEFTSTGHNFKTDSTMGCPELVLPSGFQISSLFANVRPHIFSSSLTITEDYNARRNARRSYVMAELGSNFGPLEAS